MKSNYWSCSKFADWLRGTQKPLAGTAKAWNTWEKSAKTKKIRYWLAEEGLDYLQNFISLPARCINDIRCYINNRWIFKTHALISNLDHGRWYEFETRLLHSAFDTLVNFVEIELAWKFVIFSEEDRKKYKTPWYRDFFRVGLWRNPEAGIAYLNWAAALKFDEEWIDNNDPQFGQPTPQALAAQETLILYNWWKQIRPNRPNPSEVSGWSQYCEAKRTANKNRGDEPLFGNFITSTEPDEHSRSILNIYHQLEQEQEDADTAMLVRLIKIRRSLWV